MYAHHAVLPINDLHLQIDLPAEFADYNEADTLGYSSSEPQHFWNTETMKRLI